MPPRGQREEAAGPGTRPVLEKHSGLWTGPEGQLWRGGGGGWGSGKGREGTVVPDEKVFRPQPCPASDTKVRVEARGRDVEWIDLGTLNLQVPWEPRCRWGVGGSSPSLGDHTEVPREAGFSWDGACPPALPPPHPAQDRGAGAGLACPGQGWVCPREGGASHRRSHGNGLRDGPRDDFHCLSWRCLKIVPRLHGAARGQGRVSQGHERSLPCHKTGQTLCGLSQPKVRERMKSHRR